MKVNMSDWERQLLAWESPLHGVGEACILHRKPTLSLQEIPWSDDALYADYEVLLEEPLAGMGAATRCLPVYILT